MSIDHEPCLNPEEQFYALKGKLAAQLKERENENQVCSFAPIATQECGDSDIVLALNSEGNWSFVQIEPTQITNVNLARLGYDEIPLFAFYQIRNGQTFNPRNRAEKAYVDTHRTVILNQLNTQLQLAIGYCDFRNTLDLDLK